MIIQKELFEQFLNKVTFKNHGDKYEQEYGDYLLKTFPNCERFWRVFVTPMTQRMSGYPSSPAKSISPRESVSPEVEKIANSHYSMFINFIYAFDHLNNKYLSSLEDIYIHLGSVCDLAEAVIENWYMLMLKNQGKKPELLKGISKEEFLVRADKWYQEVYPTLYDYYIKKGKFVPVHVFSRNDLLTEYLGKKSPIRVDYDRKAQKIREFRNVVAHNVKIGRIDVGGKLYIPKPSKIGDYKNWDNIRKILGNREIISRDFAEQYDQAEQDIIDLSMAINNIWELIINDFLREFYSRENSYLRNLYNIDFQPGPTVIISEIPDDHESPPTMSSGTYSGGTAIWNSENSEEEDH